MAHNQGIVHETPWGSVKAADLPVDYITGQPRTDMTTAEIHAFARARYERGED
jgi:hypothetical protein